MVGLIFLGSVALFLYVVAGYPLLLSVLSFAARRHAKVDHDRSDLPTVTLILAVRDGAALLPRKLDSIRRLEYPRSKFQIVIVDDGSRDDTVSIAEKEPGVHVLATSRAGKAEALNAGIRVATGEVLFFTDVRQPLEESSLLRLAERFRDPRLGAVSGELVITKGGSRQEAEIGLYWLYEKWIRKKMSLLGIVPGATGCIYAMRRSLVSPLPPGTLVDDMYLPLKALFAGYRVEVEPSARAFDAPTDLKTEFRRKVRTLAGNYQILRFYPRLLVPSHRLWLHFVSHKLGRLLLPYCLLAIAVCSIGLPAPWRTLSLTLQFLCYGAAVLDPVLAESCYLKRLSSPARVFVTMMVAAALAPFLALVSRESLWRPTRMRLEDVSPDS